MDHDKRVKTEEAIEILDKVRKICVEFPEVSEQVDSFGHTSFRVKDKPFVMMGEGDRVFDSYQDPSRIPRVSFTEGRLL